MQPHPSLLPLYIAAGICGIIGLFMGLMTYLDGDRSQFTFGDATNWIFGCITLLVASYLISALP